MTKSELKKVMGMNLRDLRQSRGLSIAALATYMDITPGFLGLIERGERSLTAIMMVRISTIFNVPVSLLYKCKEYNNDLKRKGPLA